MSKPVVLLTFANSYEASGYLRNLAEEKRQIYHRLERANGLCEHSSWENATLGDITELFNKHQGKVAVFHYGGHSGSDALMLEAGDGTFETKEAYAGGLAAFFQSKGLKLVFLNGCANEAQVQDFLQAGVAAVIATSRAIYDDVAREFATMFYGRLAADASIGEAFKDAEAVFRTRGKDTTRLYHPDRLREIELSEPVDTSKFPWKIHGSDDAKKWKLSEGLGHWPDNVPDPKKPVHLPTREAAFFHPLKLGHEVQRKQTEKDEAPIYEFPMWIEDPSRWRKHFEEEPAETVLKRWLQQPGIHALVGEPGGGKTTLLREWAHTIAAMHTSEQPLIPFYVPLREVTKDGLKAYFAKAKDQGGYGLEIGQYFTDKPPAQPVWLFDGLDELPSEVRKDWLKIIEYQKHHVCIVSCRTALYDSDYRSYFGNPHYVMGLYPNDQKIFLERLANEWRDGERRERAFATADETWVNDLHGKLQKNTNIRRLAGSPLLLTLIARTNPPGKLDLPTKRVNFYQKAFKQLLEQRDESESINTYKLKMILATLAFEMSQHEMVAEFDENLFEKHTLTLSKEETLALKKSGVLRFSDDHRCQWLHQTFQEWLLGEYLHAKGSLPKAVERYWRYAEYQEVLAMLWGLSNEQEQLNAARYLIEQGCQPHPKNANKKCSGLKTLFNLIDQCGEAPTDFIFDLLWHNVNISVYRRGAVALNKTTPRILLEKLAEDEDATIRMHVAGNLNSTQEMLSALANDEEVSVRVWVAVNSNTPFQILSSLISDKVVLIREKISERQDITENMLEILTKDEDATVRINVAKHPSTSFETLKLLMEDTDDKVRASVAENPKTSAEILDFLSKDKSYYVRLRVADNAKTTQETLKFLANDQEQYVVGRVAYHPNTPEEVREHLLKIDYYHQFYLQYMARNTDVPKEVLNTLSRHYDAGIRISVAGNLNTPPETLANLAQDEHLGVRWTVAGNPNTPITTLTEMVKERNSTLLQYMAMNPNTPADLLADIANEKERIVRICVARNLKTTPETLSVIASDEDWGVRQPVAENPNTDAETLARLAKDEELNVRWFVAQHPDSCLEWF